MPRQGRQRKLGLEDAEVRRDRAATTATPDHQPNANGWYKAAVTVAFAGTDVTSGVDVVRPGEELLRS